MIKTEEYFENAVILNPPMPAGYATEEDPLLATKIGRIWINFIRNGKWTEAYIENFNFILNMHRNTPYVQYWEDPKFH